MCTTFVCIMGPCACVFTFMSLGVCTCMPQGACGSQGPTCYVGPCLPLCLRQDHFVHGSILCTCLGTSRDPSLSASLTDACLCLALRGLGVFESMCFIHRAISSVPKAALPGHTCFTIKMSGMARSKFLFQYISFPISPEGWADMTGTTLSLP